MDMLVTHKLTILEGTIDLRELFQRESTCLDNQIVDANLHSIFASTGVERLAHCQEIGHIHLAADIKVWDGLLRLGQASSDGCLHTRECADFHIRRTHLRSYCGRGCWNLLWRSSRSGSGCSWCCRGLRRWALHKIIFDIIAHDATPRTGTLNLAQIDTMLFSHTTCQR